MSSRTARAIQRNPVSKKRKKKRKENVYLKQNKTNKQTKNRRNDSMPRYIRPTKLNQEEARNLNRSVTSKEIGTAIKSLPKGETQNRTDRRIHSNSSYMLPAMLLKPPIVERKNC